MKKLFFSKVSVPLLSVMFLFGTLTTTLSFLLTPLAANATTTWTQVFTDNFHRANSATVGNGWLDASGIGSITSNTLGLSSTGSIPLYNQLLRPTSQDAVDQRASFDYAANNSPGGSDNQEYVAMRVQPGDDDTEYLAGYNGHLLIAAFDHGNLTVLGGQSSVNNFNPSDSYTIDASAVGTSPTTITVTMTDDTTQTAVGTMSQTDSTADLQASGQVGLLTNSNASNAVTYDNNFTYYNDNITAPADTYSLTGPTTATISQASSSYTVAPDGTYTGTITPSDNGGGGSFNPSSLTFSDSSSPQTFTYTAAFQR